jgi:hypothetical protein
MGDIIIKRTSPSAYTYHIRNLLDITVDLEIPVIVYQIPTSTDDEALGIKVDGNKSVITLSWTLVDEDSDTVTEKTNTATADEQMAFLINDFQPVDMTYSYDLKLMPNIGSTPFFTKTGILSRISVSKSGDTPVTYTATVTFSTATMTTEIADAGQ